MKRFLAVVSLLCACFSAHAALLNSPADRLVPVFNGGVDIGLTGGWFEPTYHNNGMVIRDNSYVNPTQPDGKLIDIDSSYFFAYGAYVGYRFKCSGNDIRLRYFHMESCDNKSNAAKSSNLQILWAVQGTVDSMDYIDKVFRANGQMGYKLYRWDFEFAQHLNFCSRAHVRGFLGASFHCIEVDRNIRYLGDPMSPPDMGQSERAILKSNFDGYGPRVGLDFDYAMDHGFGVFASLSTAMLYGQVCSDHRVRRLDVPNRTARIALERCQIVPNLDLKVGFDYSYPFSNGHVGRAELGWWINTYINSINDTKFLNRSNNANHVNQLDNLTFNGFYLTLEFQS